MQVQTLEPKPEASSESNTNTESEQDENVEKSDDPKTQYEADDKKEIDSKETTANVHRKTESETLVDEDDNAAPSTAELDNALGLTDEGLL